MSPAAPRCPVARIKVAQRTYAIVDTERLEELQQGAPWRVVRHRDRPFVARWVYDRRLRRRILERLSAVVSGAEKNQRVRMRDGNYLNCTAANCEAVELWIRKGKNKRNPFEIRFTVNRHTYTGGQWPSLKMAIEIRDLYLRDLVARAISEKWDRRAVREGVDRAICRIRPRRRPQKLSEKESYD